MGKIDDAIRTLETMDYGTERALHLAGLISTLFKIKGVVLVATGQLAFDCYGATETDNPELDLAVFAGEMNPRVILEIMRGQLSSKGSLYHWTAAGIPIRLHHAVTIINRDLCRDFMTDHGVLKVQPVEEITANWILAANYPAPDPDASERAHHLLINALTDSFPMDWKILQSICHRNDYRIGEELAQLRLAAKREVDAMGLGRDHIGQPEVLPEPATPPENLTREVTPPSLPLETPSELGSEPVSAEKV